MYLRAGIFSLGLLLLSRLLGLARESVQAAAFGSTGMADVVIVMFTLPDLLVGIFLSGALAYVLLPYWAGQSVAEQNASQKKVALKLLASGLLLSLVIWCLQDPLAQALAPGPNVWIWTGLSSGLLLLLFGGPQHSLARRGGRVGEL